LGSHDHVSTDQLTITSHSFEEDPATTLDDVKYVPVGPFPVTIPRHWSAKRGEEVVKILARSESLRDPSTIEGTLSGSLIGLYGLDFDFDRDVVDFSKDTFGRINADAPIFDVYETPSSAKEAVAWALFFRLKAIRATVPASSPEHTRISSVESELENGGSITLSQYRDLFYNSLGPETWICGYLMRVATMDGSQFKAPRGPSMDMSGMPFCIGRVRIVVKSMWRAICANEGVFKAPLFLPQKKQALMRDAENSKVQAKKVRVFFDPIETDE
jgi:hypothetical protein